MKYKIASIVSLFVATSAFAQTTWTNTSASLLFSTATHWNNGLPSTGPQLAIFADSASIQHTLDLAGTARNAIGIRFDLFAGGAGFNFRSSSSPGPGFQIRAGGSVNGILNNDDNTQTFSVPVRLFNNLGAAGPGAAMVFNAAGGNLLFNATNQTGAAFAINVNGASNLTFTAASGRTITVGTSTTSGSIVNTNVANLGGLIKNGAGTLVLAGTGANTYVGGNRINAGTVTAGKANALGNGNALVGAGGVFNVAGFDQTIGILDLEGNFTLDLGVGFADLTFANSLGINWEANILDILNWTAGDDTIRFGTDATGLTPEQLAQITWSDLGLTGAQIDSSGYIIPIPVPEPSTVALSVIGGLALTVGLIRRRNSK